MTRIFIDGEAGTTGMKLAERVRASGRFELVTLTGAERKQTEARRAALDACDIAVLCLPDEAAREAVALVSNPQVKLLDASVAHRVSPGWCYGFPEMTAGQRQRIACAMRVTNPGCFATGALALLRPLVDAGLLAADTPLVLHGVSGYSGGGRQLIAAFEGDGPDAIRSNHYLYSLEQPHKHLPEIVLHSGLASAPVFIPSVGRYRQGMLVSLVLHAGLLRAGPHGDVPDTLLSTYRQHYSASEDIAVRATVPGGRLDPEALNDTNRMEIFVLADPGRRHVTAIARLDNLGKGSSGAALVNLELMARLRV